MSEHTPTPWVLGVDGIGDIFDADNRSVAKTDSWNVSTHRTPRENRANAAFIVKAVNSHDALVKAMETARRLIGAINDTAPLAVKESNINMAWHVLDDNLRALASIKEPA